MTVQIITGDCRDVLQNMPDASVNCCVTSPPYWGLRDYGCAGQIGLEQTPDFYVAELVAVFRDVRRVLMDDGTLWLNLGDSYAANRTYQVHNTKGASEHTYGEGSSVPFGLKPKDLVGIPWRVAFALQADGWYLRQDIIWHKPNPMPESVRDRCTKAHEYIFLLSKSAQYYYDSEAIKEPCCYGLAGTGVGYGRLSEVNPCDGRKGRGRYKTPDGWDTSTGDGGHGSFHKNGREKGKTGYVPKSHKGSHFDTGKTAKHQLDRAQKGKRVHGNIPGRDDGGVACNNPGQDMRNKRSVWTVTTKPYKAAHFATFPPDLIRPCILAGCPSGGTVLDPFGGSGTTGQVAEQEGRNSILIELNPQYVTLADKRTAQGGLFCTITEECT